MMAPPLPIGRLSEHFTQAEFVVSEVAARRAIDNTPPPHVWANLRALAVNVLEPAREALGPILVTSGFRCAELNRAIGGAPKSQHLLGEAADVVPVHATLGELMRWLLIHAPVDEVICEFGQWIHVSHVNDGPQRGSALIATKDRRNRTTYSFIGPAGIEALL